MIFYKWLVRVIYKIITSCNVFEKQGARLEQAPNKKGRVDCRYRARRPPVNAG